MHQEISAINWIGNYVDNVVTDLSIGGILLNEEFHLKTLGEFSLFMFLYSRNIKRTKTSTPNCLLTPLDRIIKFLKSKNHNDIKCQDIELSQIRICLKLSGYANFEIEEDKININKNNMASNLLSLEQAYIQHLSGKNISEKYWGLCAVELFRVISNEGISRKWLYQLTHFTFFSTDFGSRETNLAPAKPLGAALYSILLNSFNDAIEEKDWDLAIELALSCLYLTNNHDDTQYLYNSVVNEIYSKQSLEGFIISDGTSKIMVCDCNKKQLYSLFHTTTVGLLLHLEFCKMGITKCSSGRAKGRVR